MVSSFEPQVFERLMLVSVEEIRIRAERAIGF
jgi:hypothetical protein